MSKTESARIHEALELLNSVAADERDHLRSVISDKYDSLRDFVGELGNGAENRLSQFYSTGKSKVKHVAHNIDDNVHSNAWMYIGGTAVAALLLGYILGRSRR